MYSKTYILISWKSKVCVGTLAAEKNTYAHFLLTQRHHKWWARTCGWNDHITYSLMEHKEAINGEPGLVVEMTTPLTGWWATKRPQMVSQALWLKWPHHLHTDGAQRGHKWWARPCGWNDHTTYMLMGQPQMGFVVDISMARRKWPFKHTR